MKIGKFSEENNISIDTVRHYMDLSLIIPEKQGGQYNFDDRCKKDLEDILCFKEMGFSLNDIKSIFLFKRMGKLTPYQEEECYREFFTNKLKSINEQMSKLLTIKAKLEGKIEDLNLKNSKESFKIGIPIEALSLFKCLKCEDSLRLLEGSIWENQIINGKLKCKCGEEYIIDDGILMGDTNFQEADSFEPEYLMEYINETSPNYQENMYKGLEWAYKKINFHELKGKVILDLGSGIGFFLRHIYNDLPDNSIYIAVDHDIRRHKFLKSMIERSEEKKNIIFICSDFLKVPIKDKTIDFIIDYAGTTNYSFLHEEFLLDLIDKYLKKEVHIFGGYVLFEKFSANSVIGKECRKNFILSNVKKEIEKLGYKAIDEISSNSIEQGGKYESFFTKDEKVMVYMFYGKR